MALFPTSLCVTYVSSLTWCLALFYSDLGRMHAYSMFLFLYKDQATSFLSDYFQTSPVPQPHEKTDGGRKQLSSTAVGSRTHRGTSQQLMAPRTLAGKQGDFKVVAMPCSLSRWQLTPQRAARQGWVGGMTNPSTGCNPPQSTAPLHHQ